MEGGGNGNISNMTDTSVWFILTMNGTNMVGMGDGNVVNIKLRKKLNYDIDNWKEGMENNTSPSWFLSSSVTCKLIGEITLN